MSSPCDPAFAPAGDVSAALMVVDSKLKAIYDGRSGLGPEHEQMVEQFAASLGAGGFKDLVDGTCTLVYLYMNWLRRSLERHEEDVVEYVVPDLVATMRMMPRTFRPEVVPIMAGLLFAAGTGLSPSLWRAQYGPWTKEELNPLEALAVMVAEHVNRISGKNDNSFATRLIADALSELDELDSLDGPDGPDGPDDQD
ncbi:hypothetical protein [Streptomyces sp. 1331.2]|uniref:hypothetical protein n=1 Tax=Streptomyces sp. 1331.2 TaxID=1938835 RepID=UPI000BC5E836|nr:hypothetical protein [Streptomyces sp. 1331.2]SOB88450.1 hypothetical protein SAMN06272789_6731 [Streptomyces sp. 1331.2]